MIFCLISNHIPCVWWIEDGVGVGLVLERQKAQEMCLRLCACSPSFLLLLSLLCPPQQTRVHDLGLVWPCAAKRKERKDDEVLCMMLNHHNTTNSFHGLSLLHIVTNPSKSTQPHKPAPSSPPKPSEAKLCIYRGTGTIHWKKDTERRGSKSKHACPFVARQRKHKAS